MNAFIRSEYSANRALAESARDSLANLARVQPRAASVRLLYVAKRRRDVARERAARLAVCGLVPVFLVAVFYFVGA